MNQIKNYRGLFEASLLGLLSLIFLVALTGLIDAGRFVSIADRFAASGKVSAFIRKDLIILWRTLLLASVLGCALSLRMLLVQRTSKLTSGYTADTRLQHVPAIMIIVGAILVAYLPCLKLAFFGEDFQHIMWGKSGLVGAFTPVPNWQHYKPVGLFLKGLPAYVYEYGEFTFHTYMLIVHVVTSIVVYFFSEYLTRRRALAFVSALIYATYSMQYEAVIWCEGLYYQLCALLSVLCLWIFVEWLRKGGWPLYTLFLFLFAANILSYEQGIAAVGIFFFYETLVFRNNSADEKRLADMLKHPLFWLKYLPPAAMVLALWAIKTFVVGKSAIFVTSPLSIAQYYTANLLSFTTPGFYFGLAFGSRIAESIAGVIVVLVVFALVSLYLLRKHPFHLFLLAWIVVSIFPNALFGTLSSRNFTLPGVAYSILLATFVLWISHGIERLCFRKNIDEEKGGLARTANLLAASIIVIIVFANFLSLRDRQKAWMQATDLIFDLNKQCVEAIAKLDPEKKIHFVGRPGRFQAGEFWPPPPPFGPSFSEEMAWRSGVSEKRVIFHPARAEFAPQAPRLFKAEPDAVVYVYDSSHVKYRLVESFEEFLVLP